MTSEGTGALLALAACVCASGCSSSGSSRGGWRETGSVEEWMTVSETRTYEPAALPELRAAVRVWDAVLLTMANGLEVQVHSARVGQAAGFVVVKRELDLDNPLETYALADVAKVRVLAKPRRERQP